MYKIYADGRLLFYPYGNAVLEPKLNLELNKTGKFTFTISPKDAAEFRLQKMKTIIKVYDGNRRLYRGRILDSTRNFQNFMEITCEGELAFLLDSIQRPYTFKGSVADYFSFLITEHNKQVDSERKFKIGRCTVTDPNNLIVRSDSSYPKTWECIKEKLLKPLGGYMITRETNGEVFIDYLKDFDEINEQSIEYGENLLDFNEIIQAEEIVTAIIPLGCKLKDEEGNETEERLTIKEINGGKDYVSSPEAVTKYGLIFKKMEWDDVTLPENLLRKANEELKNTIHLKQTIEVSALDLNRVNKDIRSFRLGCYTKVSSKPHDLNELLLVRKLEINLLDPTSGFLELGDERKTFTEKLPENGKDGINGLNGKDGVVLKIDSSMGSCFKQDNISTVLTVTIFVGNATITNIEDLRARFGNRARLEWQWLSLYEEDYGIILDSDSKISRNGFALTVHPDDVDAKVTFRCRLITE